MYYVVIMINQPLHPPKSPPKRYVLNTKYIRSISLNLKTGDTNQTRRWYSFFFSFWCTWYVDNINFDIKYS